MNDKMIELLYRSFDADLTHEEQMALDEAFADPQVLHRKMVIEVEHPTEGKIRQVGIAIKLSDTPGSVRSLAPVLGEHTDEILTSVGYNKQRINELRQKGAI